MHYKVQKHIQSKIKDRSSEAFKDYRSKDEKKNKHEIVCNL